MIYPIGYSGQDTTPARFVKAENAGAGLERNYCVSGRIFSVRTQHPGFTITSSLCAGIMMPFTTRAGISTSLIIGGFQT
jgi:hypothetical protein